MVSLDQLASLCFYVNPAANLPGGPMISISRLATTFLCREEVWAALLWLRTWDLHASAGGLPPADVLHAFQFGAVWRIQAGAGSQAAGVGGDGGEGAVRQSLRAAKELQQQLGAGREAARLGQALREREGELERRATDVRVPVC